MGNTFTLYRVYYAYVDYILFELGPFTYKLHKPFPELYIIKRRLAQAIWIP